jgi:hypothetical protein
LLIFFKVLTKENVMENCRKLRFWTILLVILVVLLQACVSTPTIPVELSAGYRGYLLPPAGVERKIDEVRIRGSSSFVCRDGQHSITSVQRLGATYQVRDPNAPQPTGMAAIFSTSGPQRSANRHDHEPSFDQLINEANRQYPTETLDIRNSRTGGHIPTNARLEEYSESVKGSDGRYYSQTRTRTVWDCFPFYIADVITTESMPTPVTHTETFTMTGSTRNDNYRRANNWLEDNMGRRRIGDIDGDFDRGRLRGSVTMVARADQTYRVTSNFTIDVYDARIEVRFNEAI